MSKLAIDQKSIETLLMDKRSDFLIPDYQRPYSWTEDECGTLWDDLFGFCFPNNRSDQFNQDSEYFLGPIVTFQNPEKKLEIIDGQQRLTTILLLLRAFYDRFASMHDEPSEKLRERIETCIWKKNEIGTTIMGALKINSKVASDNDKDQFLQILNSGKVEKSWKSKYAQTFCFFQSRIQDFVNNYPSYTALFPARILQNVILLPIEAESQDTALRIFSTLNDRGRPLSDADIFKSQFYSYYESRGETKRFIERWKALEAGTESTFTSSRNDPMVELFTQYMYFVRAKRGIKDTTTPALRIFFEGGNKYQAFKDEHVLNDLEALADFWHRIYQFEDFSKETQKLLFVLQYAPNGMWTYLTSVYFFSRRDDANALDEVAFNLFLRRITAFILAYAVMRPGVNALRSPVYPEMVSLATSENTDVTFEKFRFHRTEIRTALEHFVFTNGRPVTRAILTWWAMQHQAQPMLDKFIPFDIEHIYPNRRMRETPLKREANFEALGNKSILEKRINIRASDYRFEDRRKYYIGEIGDGTQIAELRELAQRTIFTEDMIEERTTAILDSFINELEVNQLLID